MIKMKCNELGGACELEFQGKTFKEITEKSKNHGIEMFKKQDKPHLQAMQKIQTLMAETEKMEKWFNDKKTGDCSIETDIK